MVVTTSHRDATRVTRHTAAVLIEESLSLGNAVVNSFLTDSVAQLGNIFARPVDVECQHPRSRVHEWRDAVVAGDQ